MSQTETIAALVTETRNRVDMLGSTFASDTEIEGYLNREIAKWYQIVASVAAQSWYLSSYTSTTTSGTSSYALESSPTRLDVFLIMGVEAKINGSWQVLYPYMQAERNNTEPYASWCQTRPGYRIEGSNITFEPAPDGSYSFKVLYLPTPTTVAHGGSVDGIAGWNEYAVLGAAAKLALKEHDTERAAMFQAEQAQLGQLIITMAAQRDAANPERATDAVGWPQDLDTWWWS